MSTSSVRAALVASAALVLAAACSFERGPDVERAVTFDRFPLYWLGETFEGHDLEAIEGDYRASDGDSTSCFTVRRNSAPSEPSIAR